MDRLELRTKLSSNFAKGKSRFSVTILIKQIDIDDFNMPQEWLDQNIALSPKAWADITYKEDTYHGQRRIAARCAIDEKDRAKRLSDRDPREIVGLERYMTRNAGKDYHNRRNTVKLLTTDKSSMINRFLLGRV